MKNRPVEVIFCEKLAIPSKRKECEEAFRDMLGMSGTNNEISLQKLSRITGKTPAQLSKQLSESCPLCDSNIGHEH